jgi:hypothetical protein
VPKPMPDRPQQQPAPEAPAWPAARDTEVAVALPDWDLLPPAEFIARHARS